MEKAATEKGKRMENKDNFLERLINAACVRVMSRIFSGEQKLVTSMIDEEIQDILKTLENKERKND